jgi:hypothetical protein
MLAALMAVLATLFYIVFILVCVFAFKWMLAGLTILLGNKESLQDFGNLCGKTPPPPNWEDYKQKQKEAEIRWLTQHGYDWRKAKDNF